MTTIRWSTIEGGDVVAVETVGRVKLRLIEGGRWQVLVEGVAVAELVGVSRGRLLPPLVELQLVTL